MKRSSSLSASTSALHHPMDLYPLVKSIFRDSAALTFGFLLIVGLLCL